MDLYLSSLLLGVIGLVAMALSGIGHQGHGGHSHGPSTGHGNGHGGHATGAHSAHSGHGVGSRGSSFWSLMSPRILFSLALGFGAAGELVRPFLGGVLQLGAAALGAVLVERFLVTPLWNFTMRFASQPALTLESAVADEATAVTAFDANGQGIISIEVDGQVVQVLATLLPADRSLGVRVRAGQRVRIEDVNSASSRCTVSLI